LFIFFGSFGEKFNSMVPKMKKKLKKRETDGERRSGMGEIAQEIALELTGARRGDKKKGSPWIPRNFSSRLSAAR
jgi:hypothetical protein